MLAAIASMLSGGGMSQSSSATSSSATGAKDIGTTFGGINTGTSGGVSTQTLVIAGTVVAVVWLLARRK